MLITVSLTPGVVVVGFHGLSCNLFHLKEVMDSMGAFIVEYMELGFVASHLHVCVDAGEGPPPCWRPLLI